MGDAEPELRLVVESGMPVCVHHWLLGDPVNNQVVGRCKRCGARRVYSGSVEGIDRFDDYRELTASSSYYADRRTA